MPGYATDHAGLELLPLDDCLRLAASVPLGRIAFQADGELVVLPVNHLVDGQDILFRTAPGSKLSAAEGGAKVTFETDDYDSRQRAGWSVVVTGRAEAVYDDAEIELLDRRGLRPWADAVDRPYWVRIRPTSVAGRLLPATAGIASVPPQGPVPVGNVLRSETGVVRQTPFGDVGTVFSGSGVELVSVSKLGEPVEEHWFSSHEADIILVVQGQLKLEFEAPDEEDRVLGIGDVLVLPPDTRCRAFRWPSNARQPTVFVAAHRARHAA